MGIARALYHNPDVLVFDEATSALDGMTEDAVMQAVQTLSAERTMILIAHRLRTVQACDRIIMLEAGLSYLSLGVKPPTPSWGNILYDGYVSLRQSPGMVIVAGIPLILATLGFTFLGEALRDVLDPRLQMRTLT